MSFAHDAGVALIAASPPLVLAGFAAVRASKANRPNALKEASELAQRINAETIAGLEHEVDRLRADVEDARSRADAAERRADQLEVQISGLRRTIQQMAREMQSQGMTPPPEATE